VQRNPPIAIAVALLALALAVPARAATLPPHGPLRILIVSDQVNPHGLSNAQLTQPGDLTVALTAPDAGLNLDAAPDAVREIGTDDLAQATAALSVPIDDPAAYDVLVYFAHRIPFGGAGPTLQAAFVAAVDAFLVAGGGVVSFHHGAYLTAGKEAMLDLVGGTASGAVPWDTVEGQNVIDVAPGHFVTTNGVEYSGSVAYADLPRGVPAGSYAYFNNVPDERYPTFQLNPGAGAIEMLFASDYVQGGSTHVLGFTHRRPAWAGVVVAYQPGEYQPHALDDRDGNNFQVLANAIVYASLGATTSAPVAGPAAVALEAVRPNPAHGRITTAFTLAAPARAELAIHDVTGRRVRTLFREPRGAGRHVVAWDGRGDDGRPAAPGVYAMRLDAGAFVAARRFVIVR
jgi:hypothetical protein